MIDSYFDLILRLVDRSHILTSMGLPICPYLTIVPRLTFTGQNVELTQ